MREEKEPITQLRRSNQGLDRQTANHSCSCPQVLFQQKFDDLLLKVKPSRTAPWPEAAVFPATLDRYRLHTMEAGLFCELLLKANTPLIS